MTAVASLLHHFLHSHHHHRRLYYATTPTRRILANNQSNNHSRLSRSIVTSSIPPSSDVFIERPEIIVLIESIALYTNSWDKVCKSYFTNCGLHYATVDIFTQHPQQQRQRLLSSRMNTKKENDTTRDDDGENVLHAPSAVSLENLEMTLTYDLSRLGTETSPLFNDEQHFNDYDDSSSSNSSSSSSSTGTTSTSAHAVLIARGPIQCLVAQYFLESSPLAGLVLIDPLLLPNDGRRHMSTTTAVAKAESRWTTSLMELMSIIEQLHPLPPKDNDDEISFLHSLIQQESSRPLQLEAGAVPMLILYSDNDTIHRDRYRICAERTGAYHTFVGGDADHYDQVPVIKIPKKKNKKNDDNHDDDDDLQSTMRLIYEWYDEIVA